MLPCRFTRLHIYLPLPLICRVCLQRLDFSRQFCKSGYTSLHFPTVSQSCCLVDLHILPIPPFICRVCLQRLGSFRQSCKSGYISLHFPTASQSCLSCRFTHLYNYLSLPFSWRICLQQLDSLWQSCKCAYLRMSIYIYLSIYLYTCLSVLLYSCCKAWNTKTSMSYDPLLLRNRSQQSLEPVLLQVRAEPLKVERRLACQRKTALAR